MRRTRSPEPLFSPFLVWIGMSFCLSLFGIYLRRITTHFRDAMTMPTVSHITDANYILFARLTTITSFYKWFQNVCMHWWLEMYLCIIVRCKVHFHLVAFWCEKSLKSFRMHKHLNWRVPYSVICAHRLGTAFNLRFDAITSPGFLFASFFCVLLINELISSHGRIFNL